MLAEKKINGGGSFKLYARDSVRGWVNLKLEKRKRGKRPRLEKWNWYLAWNGERLAQNRDAKLLEECEPEAYQWLIETLETIQ